MNHFPWVGLAGVIAVGTGGLPQAQNVRLSAPLVRELRSGRVAGFHLTSAGTRVVYSADRTQNQYELFSRPLDGSEPSLRLNGQMQPQGSVYFADRFALGAGERVAYLADEVVDGVVELFSVPADGSAARVRLSQAGVNVHSFLLTPTGTHVVYRTDSQLAADGALHAVPIDGSSGPVTLVQGIDLQGFQGGPAFWVSPDSGLVVFSESPLFRRKNLFAVPIDGSLAPLFLARTESPAEPLASMFFDGLQFSPDGRRVLVNEIEDFDGDLTKRLSSVPVDASQSKVILASGFYQGVFAISPLAVPARVVLRTGGSLVSMELDGSGLVTLTPPGWSQGHAVLVDGAEAYFSAFLGGTTLFRAPVDGSQPTTAVCPVDGSISLVPGSGYLLVPCSTSTLAFSSSAGPQVFSVPRAGGSPLLLHSSPRFTALLPHPGGQRLLFHADLQTDGPVELHVVPLDGSLPSLRLSAPLDDELDVLETKLTPDAQRAVFLARGPSAVSRAELFQRPLDASAPPLQLNEPVPGPTVGDVTGFQLTPDGTRLVYRADLERDEDFDLVALDEGLVEQRLGDGGGSVLPNFAFTPDSQRAVFQTQADFTLHVATLSNGAATVLDTLGQTITDPFVFDPGSTHVVYRRTLSPSQRELRGVALDGLSPAVVLATARNVNEVHVSASGTVAFVADLAQDGVNELWAAPLDGSGPPVRLSQTLVTGGDVGSVALDPTGSVAVFLADARVNNRTELFAVPLDGSRTPRRLSGPLAVGGSVVEFALTPDGHDIVYRADARVDGRFELFRVPFAGSFPPHAQPGGVRRLRATLLTSLPSDGGRAVQPDWSLTRDGQAVVYRANATTPDVFDLYQVAVDGSAGPMALSSGLPSFADVTRFAIARDQVRVAFVTDARLDGVLEPFSVPLAGGTVVPLDTLPSFADVGEFRIEWSSHDLVFTADREQNGVIELYRVPLDGSAPARRLNPPLLPAEDVELDFVALPDGTVYRADQRETDVVELFFAF